MVGRLKTQMADPCITCHWSVVGCDTTTIATIHIISPEIGHTARSVLFVEVRGHLFSLFSVQGIPLGKISLGLSIVFLEVVQAFNSTWLLLLLLHYPLYFWKLSRHLTLPGSYYCYCASRDTQISFGWYLVIQGYFCGVQSRT